MSNIPFDGNLKHYVLNMFPEVKFKKTNPLAIVPQKATEGSAAFDLFLANFNDGIIFTIYPGEVKTFDLGFAVELPHSCMMMLLWPRSGSGKKGLHVANSTGLIDSDYRGNIFLSLRNVGEEAITVDPRKAIAQTVFVPVYSPTLIETDELSDTSRGAGGFGSTDKQ